MNMHQQCNADAVCPFYIRTRTGSHGWNIGIECERISDNLGFDVQHIVAFRRRDEMKDFFGLFCSDIYRSCPYYKAMMATKYKDA